MTANRPARLGELIEEPIDGVENELALNHIGLLIDASNVR